MACVRALEALAHERTVARLQQESDDPTVGSPRRNANAGTLSYDPASMYLLETMISIASKAPQHIEEVWYVMQSVNKHPLSLLRCRGYRPVVYEHLSALLSSAAQYSVLLIERAVVGLWRLCFILVDIVGASLHWHTLWNSPSSLAYTKRSTLRLT